MIRSWLCILSLLIAIPLGAQEKEPPLDRSGDPLPAGAIARLGTLRWRHGSEVTSLAYSPDGKTLASAGRDGVIRVWETSSGKQVRDIRGHKGEVRTVAFSSDGKLLVSGGTEGSVRLWEASTGRGLDTLHSGKEWINAVAFSPDGTLLAIGDDSRELLLWDMAGKRLARAISLGHPVQGLAFTRDGKHLCVRGSEGEGVELWPVAGGQKTRKFGAWPHSICLTADEKGVLVADHDHPLSLFALATGERLRVLKDKDGECRPRLALVAASPAGPSLAAGCADGHIRVFSADTGKQAWSAQSSLGSIKAIAFSPDGQTVAAAGAEGCILIWGAADGTLRHPAPGHRTPLVSVSLSPDGKRIATVARAGPLQLWQADSGGRPLPFPEALPDCSSVAYSADGKLLAASRRTGEIQLRDAATGKVIRTLKRHQGAVTSLAFTRDGAHLLSGGRDRAVHRWEVATGELRVTAGGPGNGRIESLAVSADGYTVLIADGSASPRLLDEKGTLLVELDGPDGGCLGVALSPNGRVAASGGRDNMVRLWEVASGQQRRALGGGGGHVHSLTWSADGRFVVSGDANGRVCLWDARTGLRLRELEGHRGPVLALSLSADGKRLVSGSADTTALLWDLAALGSAPRPALVKLSVEKLAALWKDLSSAEGPTAGEALQTLAQAPEQSIGLLRDKVRPVQEEDVQKLLRELDSPRFVVRDRATLDLMALGRFIEPILRKELRDRPTLEKRRRLEDILGFVTQELRSPEEIRVFRALELLEMLDTPPATKLLQELAGGAPLCQLTREAKAVLQRQGARSKDMP